jgi:RHS repeat-associated protein
VIRQAWAEHFTYTGDGQRATKWDPTGTTYYAAADYEVVVPLTGQPYVRRYYSFNGKRIATREGSGGLIYLLQDHLGSTVRTSDRTGTDRANNAPRYDAYGNERTPSIDALPTDLTYTGQRRERYTGLVEMGARWYDPVVGSFLSADTIVPGPANPQSLNRYGYSLNNPLKFIDPSGHAQICADGDEGGGCGMGEEYWYRYADPGNAPDDIRPGGAYGKGTLPWGDRRVSIYVPSPLPEPPPPPKGITVMRAAPGFLLSGEDYPYICPASAFAQRTVPPARGLWRDVTRTSTTQFSPSQFRDGLLAGLGGPDGLPNRPITPDPTETKPIMRYNMAESRGGATLSSAYAVEAGLDAARQPNTFVLQRGLNAAYRVIVVYDNGGGGRAFQSYSGLTYIPPYSRLYP